MACSVLSLMPVDDPGECLPRVEIAPFFGKACNVEWIVPGDILQFHIREIGPFSVYGLNEKPEWFFDGVFVEVDLKNNIVRTV